MVGLSVKEICRRTGRNRSTVRRAVRSEGPPAYRRPPVASKLHPHKEEVHRLVGAEPRMPATRIRELIAEAGYTGGRTILDDYLREVRPLFAPPPRTFQRTLYRPGEICQPTSGSRAGPSRSATARSAAAGSWWSAWATRAPAFSGWGEIFGDEVRAAAMIDRLEHHAEILFLKGDSYRLRDKEIATRPRPALIGEG